MGKTTIHCVRHAQGFHNLSQANHSIHDPLLTDLGLSQCRTLSQTFAQDIKINLLIASPLRRTLYTALNSFASPRPVIALAELQETSDLPCDTGSDLSVLEKEFSGQDVDLQYVPKEGWNSNIGKWSPASSAIEARARAARQFILQLAQAQSGEDVNVVVVTHGGYLHYFTGDWEGAEKYTGTGWVNCEVRSYEFVNAEGDLRETVLSREGRRGEERPLGADEQRELRAAREAEWQSSGFQNGEGESAKL